MSAVTVTGLNDILNQLNNIGRDGDKVAREAATRAATLLRQNYLVSLIKEQTGLKRSVIMDFSYVKKATPKYAHARINFSGAGIPVLEYRYQTRRLSDTRAQILVDWLGGMKVAAGFVNPKGKNKVPLSSRSQRTTKNGKTYIYRNTKPEDALAPSLATIYLDIPRQAIERESQDALSEELMALLDDLLGEK